MTILEDALGIARNSHIANFRGNQAPWRSLGDRKNAFGGKILILPGLHPMNRVDPRVSMFGTLRVNVEWSPKFRGCNRGVYDVIFRLHALVNQRKESLPTSL